MSQREYEEGFEEGEQMRRAATSQALGKLRQVEAERDQLQERLDEALKNLNWSQNKARGLKQEKAELVEELRDSIWHNAEDCHIAGRVDCSSCLLIDKHQEPKI